MKTRSNMPLYVLEVSNVKTLSNAQIDLLRCGDYLVKKDASGEHAYKVTFKSDTGMCITYHDAYCVETQSYDKIDGVWTYNSEDKTIIAEPSLENIVDKDGHKRFIEGSLTIGETVVEKITVAYAKWSLSGTHLQIVLAGTLKDTSSFTNGEDIAIVNLPDWVINKVYPVWSDYYLEVKNAVAYASDWSTQTFSITLSKFSTGVRLQKNSGLTMTADRSFRVSFDLLIDND